MAESLKGRSPEEIRAFHNEILVGNLHADFSLEVGRRREEKGERSLMERVHLPKLIEGGVDYEFYTTGGDHSHFARHDDLTRGTLRQIDHFYAELVESPSFIQARKADDILKAKEQGRRALLLTMEGAAPVEEDLSLLRNFYRLGMRSICLTWFKANPSADGVGEPRQGGLTKFGRELIREMNRLGMLIDVSQATESTVSDVLDLSEAPIVASHSGASGVHQHIRNLTDAQIERMAKGGGLVGLTTYPAHVGAGTPGFDQFMDHVDYIVRLVGDDYLCLGLNIIVHDLAIATRFFTKSNIEYTELWLPGYEDVNSTWKVTQALVERGYSEASIRKILGENLLRVLRQVIG